jgi:hypothetical protein
MSIVPPAVTRTIGPGKTGIRLQICMRDFKGLRYEDTYGEYLQLFEYIATVPADIPIFVEGAPWCWVPLLRWLNCSLMNSVRFFEHCDVVREAVLGPTDRTLVEVLCGFRPECVDALWKVDAQWFPARVQRDVRKNFIVTTNGGFHRVEVMSYLNRLQAYVPPMGKRDVVLVPCAADKPYPSPLHKAVLERMPESFYLMNVTGVLGLLPQDLWDVAPHYDSGVPYEWRILRVMQDYFSRHFHRNVVVYSDFYSLPISYAFDLLRSRGLGPLGRIKFVLPVQFYYDYQNLLAPVQLNKLVEAFKMEDRGD